MSNAGLISQLKTQVEYILTYDERADFEPVINHLTSRLRTCDQSFKENQN